MKCDATDGHVDASTLRKAITDHGTMSIHLMTNLGIPDYISNTLTRYHSYTSPTLTSRGGLSDLLLLIIYIGINIYIISSHSDFSTLDRTLESIFRPMSIRFL